MKNLKKNSIILLLITIVVLFCVLKDDFPNTAVAFMRFKRPIFMMSSLTCRANSRVGTKIKDWGLFSSHSVSSTSGIPKATVFPLPVWDSTIMSLFSKAKGITASWTAVGLK